MERTSTRPSKVATSAARPAQPQPDASQQPPKRKLSLSLKRRTIQGPSVEEVLREMALPVLLTPLHPSPVKNTPPRSTPPKLSLTPITIDLTSPPLPPLIDLTSPPLPPVHRSTNPSHGLQQQILVSKYCRDYQGFLREELGVNDRLYMRDLPPRPSPRTPWGDSEEGYTRYVFDSERLSNYGEVQLTRNWRLKKGVKYNLEFYDSSTNEVVLSSPAGLCRFHLQSSFPRPPSMSCYLLVGQASEEHPRGKAEWVPT